MVHSQHTMWGGCHTSTFPTDFLAHGRFAENVLCDLLILMYLVSLLFPCYYNGFFWQERVADSCHKNPLCSFLHSCLPGRWPQCVILFLPICRTLHFPMSLSAHASSLLRFFWMAACYAAATTSPPSLVLPTNLFRVHSLSHRLSWVGKDLKGSVCPTPVSTKDHLKIRFFVWMLSVCFLNSVKFSAMTTSLGSLFQYPTILTVKNLFLISLST